MRQRLTIILTIVVILGLLVVLNTISYVKEQKENESEITANRSSYHAGPTGALALYEFLSESGYKVMRWRETTEKLVGDSGNDIKTFVVIDPVKVPFSDEERQVLLGWVQKGGQLVLVSRTPDPSFLPQPKSWTIRTMVFDYPEMDLDPSNVAKMTEKIAPVQSVQPTIYTQDVESVLPSRFAARIRVVPEKPRPRTRQKETQSDETETEAVETEGSPAPVTHLADLNGGLLVDYSYGLGRITLLGDPFLLANNGVKEKDNLQLAINTLTGTQGLVAFDEYHQGRGIQQNEFASYFAGTPVLAIGAQIVLLILFLIWTSSRRFARPLPLVQVDRRSSLEFVASMAELQERSRAFDLAIENIYSRTRRVLARYAGVDYNTSRSEVAARVALRSSVDARSLETLMRQCEETINGKPTTWRQALDLVRRLREVESSLGLRMRSRDARQAAEHL